MLTQKTDPFEKILAGVRGPVMRPPHAQRANERLRRRRTFLPGPQGLAARVWAAAPMAIRTGRMMQLAGASFTLAGGPPFMLRRQLFSCPSGFGEYCRVATA